jgi:hypothetical protein
MAGPADRCDLLRPDTLFLMHGEPPFEPPRERLPLGYCIVDASRPLIFRARATGDSLRLEVFAPRPGPALLSFRVNPRARAVRVREPGGLVHDHAVEPGGTVRLPVLLPGGTSRLLIAVDPPAGPELYPCHGIVPRPPGGTDRRPGLDGG